MQIEESVTEPVRRLAIGRSTHFSHISSTLCPLRFTCMLIKNSQHGGLTVVCVFLGLNWWHTISYS